MTGSRQREAKGFSEVHRSARVVDVSAFSIGLALAAAVGLSFLIVRFGSHIVGLHQEIVRRILLLTGIPVTGSAQLKMPGNFEVATPVVGLTGYSQRPGFMAATGACAMALMGATYLRVRMSRMLVALQFGLLAASAVILLAGGGFGKDAVWFTALWLRFGFVTWILLLYIIALFVGIAFPAGWLSLFWTAAPTLYGILWSAVRLAFCLGILQLTGPLLAPLLWFTMGPLADVLYISAFYSFIAWHASLVRSAESK